jgi:ATP-dependent Clp protease ATP-binding subunit ClpC
VQGFNFTERVRKILAMARQEALRLNHEYVGTEHILLGLIREGEGVAAAVLQNLHVNLGEIQEGVEALVKKGKAAPVVGPELPYTSRAKKVLEFAMTEARELNHSYVGTEHLLLGLLREEKGIAAQALNKVGVDLYAARVEMLRLLETQARESGVRLTIRERLQRLRPTCFSIRIDYEGGNWFEKRFERAADVIAFLQTLRSHPDSEPDSHEKGT